MHNEEGEKAEKGQISWKNYQEKQKTQIEEEQCSWIGVFIKWGRGGQRRRIVAGLTIFNWNCQKAKKMSSETLIDNPVVEGPKTITLGGNFLGVIIFNLNRGPNKAERRTSIPPSRAFWKWAQESEQGWGNSGTVEYFSYGTRRDESVHKNAMRWPRALWLFMIWL